MKWRIWKSKRGWHAGKTRGVPLFTGTSFEVARVEVWAMIEWTKKGTNG